MGLTNQLCSDGTLRTWRWPDGKPNQIEMTETKVELTRQRRQELIEVEERVKEVDQHISRIVTERSR
jgi:hypothetical protein